MHSEQHWGFECACATHNLAASLSLLAPSQPVARACTSYQHSAHALSRLCELLREASWRPSADLSLDTVGTLQTLMLAQAQACMCASR